MLSASTLAILILGLYFIKLKRQMHTYIALFRGINVSGQKIIKMTDLKRYLEECGLRSVCTYIQSGNVVFSSKNPDQNDLVQVIKKKIVEQYGFEVSVMIKTRADLIHILDANPFMNDPERDTARMYFTMLSSVPEAELVEKLQRYDYSPEEYALLNDIVYFYSPKAYGKAKMNNNFFENKLKVIATTRNLRTLEKLINLTGG